MTATVPHPNENRYIKLEKGIFEPLSTWADNQALLTFLGLMSNIGVIVAVLTYIGTEKHRRDAEVFNAWQTITSAYGQSGSGGRTEALEFLNSSPGANWRRKFPWICAPHPICTWPAESLDGINLTIDSDIDVNSERLSNTILSTVFLRDISLPNASLKAANLEGADLRGANLEEADLRDANLKGALLISANLKGALLGRANLEGANLFRANLEEANLPSANLKNTFLAEANFKGAFLENSNLEAAILYYANFRDASLPRVNFNKAFLGGVNFEDAYIQNADFSEAIFFQETSFRGALLIESKLEGIITEDSSKFLISLGDKPMLVSILNPNSSGSQNESDREGTNQMVEQLSKALLCRVSLSKDIHLDTNRDCEELGIDHKTGREIMP